MKQLVRKDDMSKFNEDYEAVWKQNEVVELSRTAQFDYTENEVLQVGTVTNPDGSFIHRFSARHYFTVYGGDYKRIEDAKKAMRQAIGEMCLDSWLIDSHTKDN